jgi:hypothetical protein
MLDDISSRTCVTLTSSSQTLPPPPLLYPSNTHHQTLSQQMRLSVEFQATNSDSWQLGFLVVFTVRQLKIR